MDSNKNTNKSKYVYFVREQFSGYTKIGVTSGDPQKRLQFLQIGCPGDLSLDHLIRCDKEDPFVVESNLHSKFAEFRQRGEWFNLPNSELEIIKTLVTDKDVMLKLGKQLKKRTRSPYQGIGPRLSASDLHTLTLNQYIECAKKIDGKLTQQALAGIRGVRHQAVQEFAQKFGGWKAFKQYLLDKLSSDVLYH